jgi:glycosyltransferase involved in cell wall biosynthesis
MSPDSAVFVMPRTGGEWRNAVGLWVTAAGWATAAQQVYGSSWVVTPDAVATPDEVLAYTTPTDAPEGARRNLRGPELVRTAAKDVVRARRAFRGFDPTTSPQMQTAHPAFVWLHHDLFASAGIDLAKRYGCPSVSYVHAPQVWEAERWGVHRPGWSRLLERAAERPQLLASDVVACVSREVGNEVVSRFGVSPERIVESPMAVDANRFTPSISGVRIREKFGLEEAFVVGWAGTFRGFHGLDDTVEAFARFARTEPRARLLLIGSGRARAAIEDLVRRRGLSGLVVFTGGVPHLEMPLYLAAMDVAITSANAGDGFHYSPQKLREYLAMGRPSIAPRIGEVPFAVNDGEHALLYEPGDVDDLAEKLLLLHDDQGAADWLGAQGRQHMLRTGTWAVRLRDLCASPPFSRTEGRAQGTMKR